MSLYHEAADILSVPASAGGSLKSRVFGKKDLKISPQQVYALAVETCKWSSVLTEVVDNADILRHERKLTPILALLLVHDLLLAKGGISLPASHGLRASVERHKARLAAELTKVRLRRKTTSLDALRTQVEAAYAETAYKYPRWVRVNALLTSLEAQLESTFKECTRVLAIKDVISASGKPLYIDEHIPNLVAVSPSFEIIKTDAYKSGAIILQDKASCFPAYLLDPRFEDGDVIDSCAAPGNKTTHLASIVHSRLPEGEDSPPKVYAFERNGHRAKTLENMVKLAGGKHIIRIGPRQDFLKVDPEASLYKNVGCLLLDPSCSGSGIVGRDSLPTLHLPALGQSALQKVSKDQSRKRKRTADEATETEARLLIDDDGQQTVVSSEQELKARLDTLSSFQLALLRHAFEFPAAKKITYSTCSIHAQENEQVVMKALNSDIARDRGWRILTRDRQVRGMSEWPVRGSTEAAHGDKTIADACIRSYKDDGRGVMGFFVAAFVRDIQQYADDDDGPYIRDEQGRIMRDISGMPVPKDNQVSSLPMTTDPSGQDTYSGPRGVDDGPQEEPELASSNKDYPSDSNEDNEEDVGDDEWDGFAD
ncbi:NOL1/NOP2/sun family protein [Xylariales sp. AK1849]|nr:NOL1/NOP2/sun family protein [Xylariales sp. AK1849]